MLIVMIELYGLLPPQALSSLGRSRSGEKIWCEGKKKKEEKNKECSNFERDKFVQWVPHIIFIILTS